MLNIVDITTYSPLDNRSTTSLTEGRKEISQAAANVRAIDPPIKPDTQSFPSKSFVKHVESVIQFLTDQDQIAQRTVTSFKAVRKVTNEATFNADERNIRNWLALMMRKGTTPATLRRYLGKLHSLYSDYSGGNPAGEHLFELLRKAIADKTLWGEAYQKEIIRKINSLPDKIKSMPADKAVTARALLFLFYLGGAPYSTIAELRFDDALPDIRQLKEIVQSMPRERRTYVFPLRHGTIRPTQLYRKISSEFTELLSTIGISNKKPFSADTIIGWWIDSALNCGINCEDIAGVVTSIPHSHAWLNIVKPRLLSADEKIKLLQTVANRMSDNTPRWYAMSLRGNNTPQDIKEAIDRSVPQLKTEFHYFYPTQKVVKQKGDKKIREEIPFIPRILFFRSRPDTVKPLFDIIGNLAWCFRTINSPDAPYAVIPREDMENFQRVIGVMDESAKMQFVRNPDLIPDRKIRITGGNFKGYKGIIYKQKGIVDNTDMRYFILKINDCNNIVWQVRIEESFIEPINE